MTHTTCAHPSTKAARSACRGGSAAARIRRAFAAYAPLEAAPTRDELATAVLRADRWADAHVEGECSCGLTPRDCGEAMAASEIAECR